MNWVNSYLSVNYIDGGRGPDDYDCWGLVREARHLHCGKRLLPSWGHIRNTMPKEFTEAYQTEAQHMEECRPEHGAVAAVFRGALCLHVALVIEQGGFLYTMDINPKKGVRFQRLADFLGQYMKVLFYRDRQNIR